MKTKSTLTAALMVLSAFLGSFLAGILLGQDKVIAATGPNGRFTGWLGHAAQGKVSEFFILDTASGEVNWYNVELVSPRSSIKDSNIDVTVFQFSYNKTTGRKIK